MRTRFNHLFDQLYLRLAAVLLLLFALLGVLFVLALRAFDAQYQEEILQRSNRDLAMYVARQHRAIGPEVLDASSIAMLFPYVMTVNPIVEAYVLDRQGRILAASGANAASPTPAELAPVDLAPVRAFLSRSRSMPIRGTNPRAPGSDAVFSASPIGDERNPVGYVYVVLGRSEPAIAAMTSSRGYVGPLLAVVVASALLFVLVTALLLFRGMTGRLQRLTGEVEAFRAGGFVSPPQLPVDEPRRDEIERLTRVFREMGDKIVQQLDQLRAADLSRRTAVLNASHDLRTPLAALQGYLQTLLWRGNSLTDEQKRTYLEIANRHSERLSRLVDQMFELAKLDAPETAPRRETFSVAELASDIGQKYQLHAEQRQVTLAVEVEPRAPALNADIAMVERLIENLVENALRFTPAGGRVTVGASATAAGLQLTVSDTGCGIAADELPRVFDRFYSVARAGAERSSGLGLAIVKRIVELHGAYIHAESQPGQGSRFSVLFPAASAIAQPG
jgi:signal transduction histidine kinase